MAIEGRVRDIARLCLGLVLEDSIWVALGWKRRRKFGAFNQRLRSKWRVQLEKTYLKELVILSTASELKQRPVSPNEMRELIALYVDGAGSSRSRPLWSAFGYPSRDEATAHLEQSINLYLGTPLEEWVNLGFKRVGLTAIPDGARMGRLAPGTISVLQNIVQGRTKAQAQPANECCSYSAPPNT
jgi:hypothetical protein